jgi:amidase
MAGGGRWVGQTAVGIAAAVRTGEVTPLEVADAHLERVAALDDRLGAFHLVRADQVRAEAVALGDRPDLAELPLAGVPVAIKDNVHLDGAPTRHGSKATPAEPAAADAEPVRRLRAAGALLIGKTSVPELCLWPFTESEAFGATRNPWSLLHSPGGSSGGSGAAVAAAMVPLALGADGGGSIRIPASKCGLVGIKPGRGVVPWPPGVSSWLGMSELGPLATTVADLGLCLDVLAGEVRPEGSGEPRRGAPDGRGRAGPTDGSGTTGFRAVAPPDRPLRVGVSAKPAAVGVRVHGEVLAALEATAEALRQAGHRVAAADPPWRNGDATSFLHRVFLGCAEDAEGLPLETLEPRTRAEVRVGRVLRRATPAPDGPPARALARYRAWFDDHDVLLSPTLAAPPLRIGAYHGRGLSRTVLGLTGFMPFTPPLNLVGFPAASVPAGFSADGLPIGVQLAAAPGGEALLLSLARQLEILRPWPRHAPLDPVAPGRRS